MATNVTYNIVDEVTPIDRAFFAQEDMNSNMLDACGVGTKIGAKTVTWFEQPKRVYVTAVKTEHTAADGTLIVDDATIFTTGDLIKADAITFLVTAINTATFTLTVTIIDGSDATIAVDAVVTIVESAVLEGDTGTESTAQVKTEAINVTQIFKRVASVTGSAFDTSKEVGQSQLEEDVADQAKVLRKFMKKMIWSDIKLAPANNSTIRKAGGIPYWITTNSGYIATAGAGMDIDNLSNFVDYMVETQDYNLKEIWMNPAKHSAISAFDISYFTKDMNESTRGYYADSFLSKRGNRVLIRTDRDIPVTKVYAVNSSDVKVVPFRDMKTEPLAKTGDLVKVQLVGEYTVTVNPANKMGVITFTS